MGARVALGMPDLVLKDEDRAIGLAMGTDTWRLDWPSKFDRRWQDLMKMQTGLPERIGFVDQIVARHMPQRPHYYLGVLGVDPAHHGHGAGSRLIEAFCALSDQYPDSHGVFIETAETANARYYQKRVFELVESTALNESHSLHCLFRPRSGERRP